VTLRSLREQIALVSQDIVLFDDTIAANIAYGNEKATREDIEEAARAAYLMPFVESLQKGLDTPVGEAGSKLSGGQKQRISIARALLKNAPILLLDEATSALDTESEKYIQKSLDELMKGRTTFVVAHRLSTIIGADKIVVMKDGIVQQIGKPQNVYDDPVNLFVAKFLGTPPINVFSGEVKNEQLYIGSEAVLSTPGVSDQPVHVGIRPEGFILKEDGPLSCDLVRLEVMGRDVSIVSTHEKSQNVTIRSIIDADEGKSLPTGKVHFGLKPAKVFLFCTDTEERIRF